MALKLVCAWCKVVMREGDAESPISHGMCDTCFGRFFPEAAKACPSVPLARATRTASNGDVYAQYGDCWLCEQYAGDILITTYDDTFEVHVHERGGQAEVTAGPYRAAHFDMCAVWGAARAGERQ